MTRPGIFDVTVQIWRKEGDHPMSDGNRNAGREALPAGPQRPSITLPAELAVHLGRELSASAVDDNGWTDLHLRGGPGLAGVAPGAARGRSAVERAAADRRRAARPGAAEHAEPLRPGPVQPVPPDRRDPAAHRCAEGHAPPHWAASGDAVAAVEVLLSPRGSIHTRADDGSKPLDAAAARHAWRAGRAVAVERRQYGDDARRRRRLLPGYRFGDGALTRARPTTSGLSRTGTGIRDGE